MRTSGLVKRLKVAVLAEDSVSESQRDVIAKHGLSFLIEAEGDSDKVSVLMDTGPSPDIVLHNAEMMGVDLTKIDAVFLSHGHYDHTGGLVGILKQMDKEVPVVAHPKVFGLKLKLDPNLKHIGSPFKPSEVEASGGVLLLAHNPVTIAKGVLTSGEIERGVAYEKVEDFWAIEGETFKEDLIPDDQALAINLEGKGLVVVSGCAHSGIINTIRTAQKVADISKVYAVLGGFHLVDANDKRIQLTVKELLKISPEVVCPCHCTGSRAVHRLVEAFGDLCKPLRTGDTIEF
jgi:7,8-dihydropterin-6-yl-methyl-4-(beta-D-ribofuranosyl)aminobenzene 5'-phosphate synthase